MLHVTAVHLPALQCFLHSDKGHWLQALNPASARLMHNPMQLSSACVLEVLQHYSAGLQIRLGDHVLDDQPADRDWAAEAAPFLSCAAQLRQELSSPSKMFLVTG